MKIGKGIQSVLINGAFLVGSNWIEILLRFAYVVMITRWLGPDVYGVWAYVMATYLFGLAAASFGLDPLVGIDLGQRKSDASARMSSALALRIIALAVAAVGIIVFALFSPGLPGSTVALLLVLPALFARSISELARSMFTGLEKAATSMRIRSTLRLSEVVLGAILLLSGQGMIALIVLHVLTWVLEALWSLSLLRRSLGQDFPSFDNLSIADYARRGIGPGITALLAGWMTAAPLILYAPLAPDGEIFGAFGLALQLAMILTGSITAFMVAALPILSRTVALQDRRARVYGPLSAALGFSACAVIAVAAIPIAPPLVTWVFGPQFALTGTLLPVAALLAGVMVLPTGYGQANLLNNRVWVNVLANVIGSVVILLTFGEAVAQWGAPGAVWAAAGGWMARAIVLIALTRAPVDARRDVAS